MKNCLICCALFLFLPAIVLAQNPAAFPEDPLGSPVLVTIDFPGAFGTHAYGINNSGRIVGAFDVQDGEISHAFLYYQGAIHKIDPPKPEGYAVAYGINSQGDMVGSDSHPGFQEGFSFRHGAYRHMAFGGISLADGINDDGLIVGAWASVCCNLHGYLYNPRNKQVLTLDYPGSFRTIAAGINRSGVIVGAWLDSTNAFHGFVRDNGTLSSVDVPGASSTFLVGVNKAGTMSGFYKDAAGLHHGFVVREGAFRLVDFPGAAQTTVWGINDLGMIVGDYVDSSGVTHGFFGHL